MHYTLACASPAGAAPACSAPPDYARSTRNDPQPNTLQHHPGHCRAELRPGDAYRRNHVHWYRRGRDAAHGRHREGGPHVAAAAPAGTALKRRGGARRAPTHSPGATQLPAVLCSLSKSAFWCAQPRPPRLAGQPLAWPCRSVTSVCLHFHLLTNYCALPSKVPPKVASQTPPVSALLPDSPHRWMCRLPRAGCWPSPHALR